MPVFKKKDIVMVAGDTPILMSTNKIAAELTAYIKKLKHW